jgi:hypothetical protein
MDFATDQQTKPAVAKPRKWEGYQIQQVKQPIRPISFICGGIGFFGKPVV